MTTVPDPLALPAFTAICVTGEERNCGSTSGTLRTPDALTRWIAEHCAQTGHEHYEQTRPSHTPCRARSVAVKSPCADTPPAAAPPCAPSLLTAVATATPTDSPAQPRTPAEPETATDLRIRR